MVMWRVRSLPPSGTAALYASYWRWNVATTSDVGRLSMSRYPGSWMSSLASCGLRKPTARTAQRRPLSGARSPCMSSRATSSPSSRPWWACASVTITTGAPSSTPETRRSGGSSSTSTLDTGSTESGSPLGSSTAWEGPKSEKSAAVTPVFTAMMKAAPRARAASLSASSSARGRSSVTTTAVKPVPVPRTSSSSSHAAEGRGEDSGGVNTPTLQ
mmetsp:Transcript_17548/g.59633  ORF Transcript_17548/g.59633 Transcript_17548/m.59633 type:complete len:215 (+) Transcript_17548:2910-3554(+)